MEWLILLFVQWQEPDGKVYKLTTSVSHEEVVDKASCLAALPEIVQDMDEAVKAEGGRTLMIAAQCASRKVAQV